MQISEIRGSITEKEAAQLYPVFEQAFGVPPSPTFLSRLNEKNDLSVLVVRKGSEIVGFKIGYTRFQGVFFSWLGAVSPEHRRMGIGRQLIRQQHKMCVEREYQEIQTETAGTNQAMLILNLQEGFEVSGVFLGHADKLSVQLRKVWY